MKRKLVIFAFICIVFLCSNSAVYAATPTVDASEKVYDYANLFTSEEEEDLKIIVKDFINTYNMDMVIVTINKNDKSSSMAYADDFYDYNNFGIGSRKDGLLFLIDMDKRKIWISTTGKAIDVYKSHTDSILDDCYSYVKSKEYYKCALAFVKSSEKAYSKHKNNGWIGGISVGVIASILIPTIFCLVQKSKHKSVRLAKDANSYIDRSTFKLTREIDSFSHSHVSKVPRASSSSGGGGGTHFGSSGTSHGGGGRSF